MRVLEQDIIQLCIRLLRFPKATICRHAVVAEIVAIFEEQGLVDNHLVSVACSENVDDAYLTWLFEELLKES